jgi:hypothetical protein
MNFCHLPQIAMALLLAATSSAGAQTNPAQILLKDYRPRSIFKIPETRVEKARFPVVDMHSHNYGATDDQLRRWVQTMDQVAEAARDQPDVGDVPVPRRK